MTTYLDECLESFRINAWYSDLHFFFAYFRGKLFSLLFCWFVWHNANCDSLYNVKGFNKHNDLLLNPWYDLDFTVMESRRRGVNSFLAQFSWDGCTNVRLVTSTVFISYASCIAYIIICLCRQVLFVSSFRIKANSTFKWLPEFTQEHLHRFEEKESCIPLKLLIGSISLECGMKVCPHIMLNCWKKIGQLWREFLRLTILNEEIGLPRFSRILTRNVLITFEVGIHWID